MRKIAVTGTISTGKSTVCQLLQDYGAYVVDADLIVHQILVLEDPIGQQVVKLLGPGIITNNQIDRKKISNIVFSNSEKLKKLESILHPAVRYEINHLFETVKSNHSYRFFVAEVSLLYEAAMQDDFDVVIALTRDPQHARQKATDVEEFDKRSLFQYPQSIKQKQADYVISNRGNLSDLKAEISNLIPQLFKEYE